MMSNQGFGEFDKLQLQTPKPAAKCYWDRICWRECTCSIVVKWIPRSDSGLARQLFGPRGNFLKRAAILYISEKGSINDPGKEVKLGGRPAAEHLNELFMLMIQG
ncbi:KH domain-containing protein At2g38610-like [Ziziphus jujuba]|uniref:KH domain-containing protein At2g38610-like n=1 Tax=Ziziphus jujuba TaxID=326968 RepID=A0ABM3ZU82_ZIZJJ|nr:KH domain-containing protein At2g38610-like [Ziziphus jujuba]